MQVSEISVVFLVSVFLYSISMFLLLTLSIATADFTDRKVISKGDMQSDLMRFFYADTNKKFQNEISRLAAPNQFCQWIGIHCAEGTVIGIWYASCDVGNFNIDFAPNTVLRLSLHAAMQRYTLDTRLLPRSARAVILSQNQLHGSICLQTLPELIEDLNVSNNRFRGIVSLINMPKNLRTMDLSGNKFTQNVVYYSNLPEKMESIVLQKTNIKFVRCALEDELDGRACSASVFNGIKPEHVH